MGRRIGLTEKWGLATHRRADVCARGVFGLTTSKDVISTTSAMSRVVANRAIASLSGQAQSCPEDGVGVLNARLAPKDGSSGGCSLHSGALQKAHGWNVASISDTGRLARR